jgi:hypothetical protein
VKVESIPLEPQGHCETIHEVGIAVEGVSEARRRVAVAEVRVVQRDQPPVVASAGMKLRNWKEDDG